MVFGVSESNSSSTQCICRNFIVWFASQDVIEKTNVYRAFFPQWSWLFTVEKWAQSNVSSAFKVLFDFHNFSNKKILANVRIRQWWCDFFNAHHADILKIKSFQYEKYNLMMLHIIAYQGLGKYKDIWALFL